MLVEPKIESRSFSRYYTALEPILAKPKIRAYTMIILSFFTMSFFGYFAIKPTLATISTLRRQIEDARFVDQKLQEKINALSQAQMEYEAIKPDLGIIFNALPPESNFPSFVKDLEGMATASSTTISALSFQKINLSAQEATRSSQEIPINFSLTLSGSYTNLASFVKRLSGFERLAVIDKMGLVTAKEKDKDEIDLTLIGKTFYVE